MRLTLPLLAVTWVYLFIVAMGTWKVGTALLFAIALFCCVGSIHWKAERAGTAFAKQCVAYSALLVGIVANLMYLFAFCGTQYAARAALPLPLVVFIMFLEFDKLSASADEAASEK
jgi:hypothetical protein